MSWACINTYDLVDGNGALVTTLGLSTSDTTLYLVENGDVSLDGSLPAMVLPFGVGTTVILGVTAWEISDACQTMKELDALEKAIDPDSKTDLQVEKVCGHKIPTPAEVLEMAKESPQKAWDFAKPYVPDSETFSDINFDDIEWGNMWTNSLDAGSSLATGVKKGTGKLTNKVLSIFDSD